MTSHYVNTPVGIGGSILFNLYITHAKNGDFFTICGGQMVSPLTKSDKTRMTNHRKK